MEHIYLSRRNLMTLLSKLDRLAAGQQTACTLVKFQQANGQPYNQTIDAVMVTAVPDEVYYPGQARPAGEVYQADEVGLPEPSTGVNEADRRGEPLCVLFGWKKES